MMDSPFFRSYWDTKTRPLHGPSTRGIPVRDVRKTQPPKVVSIPVRFVGPERSRSELALKIQKVFRGFLVRKSVKKIMAIRRDVDEIEKKIAKEETVELMGKDSKERLRVNEMLMSLLFRLDSVRGVDSGVRDCRKAVIKKVIALQEVVDGIVVDNEAIAADDMDTSDAVLNQEVEVKNGEEATADDEMDIDQTQTVAALGNARGIDDNNYKSNEVSVHQNSGSQDHEGCMVNRGECNYEVPEAVQGTENLPVPEHSVKATGENQSNDGDGIEKDEDIFENHEEGAFAQENWETSERKTKSDSSVNRQSLVEVGEGDDRVKEEEMNGCAGGNKNQRSKKLLERIVEDNEKMMRFMWELLEKNQMQTQLLRSLSQRVEQLEKAFLSEKLRKKKKRQAASTVVTPEKLPDLRKLGE